MMSHPGSKGLGSRVCPCVELAVGPVLASSVQLPVIPKNVWPRFVTALDLFHGVAQRDVRKITRLCTEKWFSRGVTIFREGEPADSFYVLKKGMVRLISLSDQGRETILHILKADEVFGELLLSEQKRAFTAIATEDSLVTIISQESFVELLSAVPTVALNFIRLLSKRLATVERGLAGFSHTWSYHRLARVLLQLSEKYGQEVPAGTLINAPPDPRRFSQLDWDEPGNGHDTTQQVHTHGPAETRVQAFHCGQVQAYRLYSLPKSFA